MILTYHGLSCVTVTATTPSGEVNVVLDPYASSVGLRTRTLTGDAVFASQEGDEHGNIGAVEGTPFLVDFPGEYEVKGVMMDARVAPTKGNKHHRILRLHAEGMTVGFLGAIDRSLNDKERELLEGADILILPVGGGGALEPKQAAELTRTLEPRIVVPVYFDEKGLKTPLKPLKEFKAELGSVPTEESTRLKVSRKNLPVDDMLLAVLTR